MNAASLPTSQADGSANASAQPQVLILGCGYLGRILARNLLGQHRLVHGSTRSPDHAITLWKQGVHPLILDVTQRITLAALRPLCDGQPLEVYYLIPPGRPSVHSSPQEVLGPGLDNILGMLKHANITRAIMTSSTAVYQQHQGQRVTAATPTHAPDQSPGDKAALLLDAERRWLAAGDAFYVLRLAGLYGPRRVIGLEAIKQRAPIAGDPQAMLNLIHVHDAASLLMAMMTSEKAAKIELGADSHPVTRQTYYNHLASLLHLPPPAVMDEQTAVAQLGPQGLSLLRRATNKHCDARCTFERLQWQPGFTDFTQGLAQALNLPPTQQPLAADAPA